MDADFIEVEQVVEQPDVPIRGAARTDVAEHTAAAAREIFPAERCHGAGAHRGERGGVEDRAGDSGVRIEQAEQCGFG